MTNPFYNPTGIPTTQSRGSSAAVKAEFASVGAGFDAVNTASAVAAITSGTINNATIGATTPSTGKFTTLIATGATTLAAVTATDITTTGNTILGDASTDTLNVGNGGIIKNASGNVGIGVSPSYKLDVAGTLHATGAVTLDSTMLVSGNATISGSFVTSGAISTGLGVSTGDASIELGGNRTGDGNAFIDFHATSGTDFEGRLIRNTGANGSFALTQTGTGLLAINHIGNGSVQFTTNNIEAARVDTSQRVLVGITSANASGAKLQTVDGVTFPSTAVASTDPNTLDDYREATYTGTLTGCTTSPTATIEYVKAGRLVTIGIAADFIATSNTTACTITGGPAQMRPTAQRIVVGRTTNNGTRAFGAIAIETDGTLTLSPDVAFGAFTNSGTKGVNAVTFSYFI